MTRLGGPIAVLEETAPCDVVFCAHAGFDGLRTIGDIWRGKLVGTTIHVRFQRFPGSEVPAGREDKVAWLYERWQEVDDWVGAKLGEAAPAPTPV